MQRPLWILFALLLACGAPDVSAPPPLEIRVVEVIQRDQPIHVELVGQTRGSADIPIRARVEGFLESIDFEEGGLVELDDLLYTIDAQPFNAKVVEARGYLAEARTMLVKAKADLDRIRPLAEMRAVSQQDLDAAIASHDAARGALKAARAQLEQTEIELSYTRIHAPINGRIGISEARVGEFVGKAPNPVVLNFVSQIHPIRVRFSIDERLFLSFARKLITERDLPPEQRSERSKLELILADGTIHQHKGQIVATDAAINPQTGTFTIEADFPNPDGLVLAGQFARVRGVSRVVNGALLVPQRAIAELQGSQRVFVISEDGSVQMRPIESGPPVGRLRVIESGVNPGERVAFEGLQRLTPESRVSPRLTRLDESGAPLDPPKDEGGAGKAPAGA